MKEMAIVGLEVALFTEKGFTQSLMILRITFFSLSLSLHFFLFFPLFFFFFLGGGMVLRVVQYTILTSRIFKHRLKKISDNATKSF